MGFPLDSTPKNDHNLAIKPVLTPHCTTKEKAMIVHQPNDTHMSNQSNVQEARGGIFHNRLGKNQKLMNFLPLRRMIPYR
jgi:hypothetical protein